MSKTISRRKFIKISTIGLLATGSTIAAVKIITRPADKELPSPYHVLPDERPAILQRGNNIRFFNDQQYAIVATIAAIIVPTDDTPGATEAGVVDYIDKLVNTSKKKQTEYVKGLNWINKLSQNEYGEDFLRISIREQIKLLLLIDKAESSVRYRSVYRLAERVDRKIYVVLDDLFGVGDSSLFFKRIREDVFSGYYSNSISWKAAGYYGPPQPVGYLDYMQQPSIDKYIDTARQINNSTCKNCHFDQNEKDDHNDLIDCMTCHQPHFPMQGSNENE